MAKDRIDQDTAFISYHDCLKSAARLATAATSNHAKEFGARLLDQIEENIRGDLLRLSLAMRRLAEICDLKEVLLSEKISEMKPTIKGDQIEFYKTRHKPHTSWELIGKIIHHRTLECYHDEVTLRVLLGAVPQDIWEIYKTKRINRSFTTAFSVESDKGRQAFFLANDLVHCAQALLSKADDRLYEEDILVGDYS